MADKVEEPIGKRLFPVGAHLFGSVLSHRTQYIDIDHSESPASLKQYASRAPFL